eukprot:5940901-Pyramimonas_sp.AAC.1
MGDPFVIAAQSAIQPLRSVQTNAANRASTRDNGTGRSSLRPSIRPAFVNYFGPLSPTPSATATPPSAARTSSSLGTGAPVCAALCRSRPLRLRSGSSARPARE